MDKPEENKPGMGGGFKKPPRPPFGGQKPGEGVPKGPVPPRGPAGIPRIPPPGMKSPKLPGYPPKAPGVGKPGLPTRPPPKLPATPGVQKLDEALTQAESSQSSLEEKIFELEKRLAEEREKVLLASLRSKSEEAVSFKVENSIKDIQDKLRREKKEKELEEAKHKAETRVEDLERRLGEEREAWVSTLKNQLGQRDQVSQEMESHFSTRLKDLEYRWAQEKSGLEGIIKDREADIHRFQNEYKLKTDQDKAFWEDRLRALIQEKDKYERELDRLKDKVNQEKEQFLYERQNFRDTISRLEGALRVGEDKSRLEKETIRHEMESKVKVIEHQADIEKKTLEGRIGQLKHEIHAFERTSMEKSAQSEAFKSQISSLQAQIDKTHAIFLEMDRNQDGVKSQLFKAQEEAEYLKKELKRATSERGDRDQDIKIMQGQLVASQESVQKLKQAMVEIENENAAKRKRYEEEIDRINTEFKKAKKAHAEEVGQLHKDAGMELRRATSDAEARVKSLQGKLEWYDANASREYSIAREKVKDEIEVLQEQVEMAGKRIKELETDTTSQTNLLKERDDLRKDLEQSQSEVRQLQWEVERKMKRTEESLRISEDKVKDSEEARRSLAQELKQVVADTEYERSQMHKRQGELERLRDKSDEMEKSVELNQEKVRRAQKQVEEYKAMLQGKEIEGLEEIKTELAAKTRELELNRKSMKMLNEALQESQKKEEVREEKERGLRDIANEKSSALSEYKNRIKDLEWKMSENLKEREELEHGFKDQIRKIKMAAQRDLDQTLEAQKIEIEEEHKQAMPAAVNKAVEEAVAEAVQKVAAETEERVRSEIPAGPDSQALESQIRQQLESEMLDKLRNQESAVEEKIKELKEEGQKERDRLQWENNSLKEEGRRLKETRNHIEREAKDLLQKAEEHYKKELLKAQSAAKESVESKSGIFTSLGRLLDFPLLDTKKSKKDKKDKAA